MEGSEKEEFYVNLYGDNRKEQWVNGMIAAVNVLIAVSQGGSKPAIDEVHGELVRCIKTMGDAADKCGVFEMASEGAQQ